MAGKALKLQQANDYPADRSPGAASAMRRVPWQEFATPGAVAAWDRLADEASEANPFFESWYLLPSLHALAREGGVGILRFEHDGRLAGLMPVCRVNDYDGWPFPHFANWVHHNCFLGAPLVRNGLETEFWSEMLARADEAPGLALFCHLYQMPLEGALYDALVAACEAQGRDWGVVLEQKRAVLRSDLGPEDYLAETLSKKKRKELRRQLGKLEELGEVRFVWDEGAGNLQPWIDDFLRIEAAGWKGESGSALDCEEATRTLFGESLRGAAERGRLIRVSLQLDAKPIAMLANFVTRPGSFGFKTAFDETYAAYSPGVLLEREYLSTLTRDDIDWCDSCAAPDHPVISRLWTGRRRIGRISIGIGGKSRQGLFRTLLRIEQSRNAEEITR